MRTSILRAIALCSALAAGLSAAEPASPPVDPKPYFEKSFVVGDSLTLYVKAVERPADARDVPKGSERDLTKHRTIVVTAEINDGTHTRNVGQVSGVLAQAAHFESVRREMATPVFDALLVDDTLYLLLKAGTMTTLHALSDAKNYVAGGHGIVASIAADTYGSGLEKLDDSRGPICVGFLRGAKILKVNNHREVRVELIGAENEKYVRDIPFLDTPLKIPH